MIQVSVLLLALVAAPAPALPDLTSAPRPGFTPVRWNEDWSFLRDAGPVEPLDPLKLVRVNDQGTIYLSLGGQARWRWEYFRNPAFGAGPADDNGYHLFRFMPHADLHIGENLRFFFQGISALSTGRAGGPRPNIDRNDLDIHQAFADVHLPIRRDAEDAGGLTLRAGRQNLIYGAQRLISPLDWTNTRRTFDGAKLSFAYGPRGSSLDVFCVRPVIVERGPLDEVFNPDAPDFAGIYNTIALPNLIGGANSRFEQYLLYLHRDNAPFFQGVGRERRFTLGGRFYANPKPWDADLEAAVQFGDFAGPAADGDILAFFVAGEAGYTFQEAPLTPRLFGGATYASGDRDPEGAALNTFNHLFPLAHAYLGWADVLGRQNVISGYAGTELVLVGQHHRLAQRVTLQAVAHAFWRASKEDGIYTVGGLPGRSGGESRYIASEIDLRLNWQINRNLTGFGGFSHVFAGDFIEETGPSEDISFLYVSLQFTF